MSRPVRSVSLLSDLLRTLEPHYISSLCSTSGSHAWTRPACHQPQRRYTSQIKDDDDAAAAVVTPDPTATPEPPTDAPPPTSTKFGLRRLSDVLGTPLSAALTAQAAKEEQDGPTDQDMEALFGGPSSRARAQAAAHADGSAASAAPKHMEPAPAPVELDPVAKLIHPKYGFAALGGVTPGGSSALGGLFQAQPRIHPRRTFAPGQSYEPEELNAYAERASAGRSGRQRFTRLMPSVEEVGWWADYKNTGFLEKFVSPAGRLVSRKVTRLPIAQHSHVMRQIKIARQMGFMAHETRLEKPQLVQVREKELREAQEQGLV